MKNLIFIMLVFACGLSQCKKSADVSSTVSDENLARTTEDADTSKNIGKSTLPSDTISIHSMSVNPDDSTASIFIRMFYEEYLLGFENGFAESIGRKYCTPDLIKKTCK